MKLFMRNLFIYMFVFSCPFQAILYADTYTQNDEQTNERAFRPDALHTTGNSAIVGKACGCDQSQVLALLAAIKKQINGLEESICIKFQQTWTILDNLITTATVDFNNVFTTLDFICDKIEAGFEGTFSVLNDIDQEIIDTQTILCDKFLQTWTILLNIENNLGCPSIPITQADVDAGSGTYMITASGNYFLAEDIVSDFAGGPLTGIIQIASSNISLDMCGRKIIGEVENSTSGILVEPGFSNIRIRNGTIQEVGLAGIVIRNGVCDFLLEHITVTNAAFGFELNDLGFMEVDFVSNGLIKECQAINCSFVNTKSFKGRISELLIEPRYRFGAGVPTRFVLIPSGGLAMRRCTSITVHNSNFSENTGISTSVVMSVDVFGTQMIDCTNCLFSLCTMNNNWGQQSGRGLSMFNCMDNTFESCVFNGNRNTSDMFFVGGGFGVSMSECMNNVFRNCQAAENIGIFAAAGFSSASGGKNTFINCVASGNNGPGGGFFLDTEAGSNIKECQSLANTATIVSGNDCAGFVAQLGRNNLMERCQAIGNVADDVGAGYILGSEAGSSIINCVCQESASIAATAYGILLDVTNTTTCIACFVKNNSVMTTTGLVASFGYRDEGSPNSSSLFTGNFGFNNDDNFSVVYPSGPLPVVLGSLSGGLPATGTSGTFDNISIDP